MARTGTWSAFLAEYNTSVELPDLHFRSGDSDEMPFADSQPVDIQCAPVADVVYAQLIVGLEDLGQPSIRLGEAHWHWDWHPQGRTGEFSVRLIVRDRNGQEASRIWRLEIGPAKLARDQYEQLLAALQRVAAGLIYEIDGGKVGSTFDQQADGPRSLLEEYWTRLMAHTASAVTVTNAISRSPRLAFKHHEQERLVADLDEPRGDVLARLVERPLHESDGDLAERLTAFIPRSRAGRPQLPQSIPVRRVDATPAMYEHSLLAGILNELQERCRYVARVLGRELDWRKTAPADTFEPVVFDELQGWRRATRVAVRTFDRLRTASFLSDIEPTMEWRGWTDLMRRDRRYRQIGQLWQTMSERPFVALDIPLFDLPIADLPTLYEHWCLLEVVRAIMPIGTLVDQQLFQAVANRQRRVWRAEWKISSQDDVPLMRWQRADGASIALYYHRRYLPEVGRTEMLGSLDPYLRIPDIAVEVSEPSGEPSSVLIFDAKYRVTAAGTVPEETLGDAYTYQAAIGYGGTPAALGVFLLFPGSQGFSAGQVGAIPLTPGDTSWLSDTVAKYLGGAS